MKHGDWAWIALGITIVAYEAFAPHGELLSEACDRYRRNHPIPTYLAIAYTAGHLARLWPHRVDPLTQLANRLGR